MTPLGISIRTPLCTSDRTSLGILVGPTLGPLVDAGLDVDHN